MPAPDPVWSASVTRDSLSLAPLILTDRPTGYWVTRNGIGPGASAYRKTTAKSPFVEGRYLVNKVKDTQILKVEVRVRGADSDWLDYLTSVVMAAFEQDSYTLQVSIDGVRHHWLCEAADGWSIGQGGQWDDLQAASFVQSVTFNVPRQPTPLFGRL